MEPTPFDEIEKYKTRADRLRGALFRELLRLIACRTKDVFPEATHIHTVLYPDNVYRVWAVTKGRLWLAVCEDDVAPSWTSINMDRDVDLLVRLAWGPRVRIYTRQDGVEVHSLDLYPRGSSRKKASNGRAGTRRVDQGQVPGAEDPGPVQGWK